MSDYTLAGEIVLRDLFSASLDKLETGARSAETQVNKLGDEVDGIGTGAGIQPLLSQIDRLQGEAAAAQQSLDRMMKEVETTPALAKVKQLEAAIASIRAKAGSGIPLTVGDVGEFQRLNGELTSLQGGLTGVQGKAAGVKSAFAGIGGMLAGLGLAFGAQQIVSGTIALIKQGAAAEQVTAIYERLTTAQGINADQFMAQMQEASRGAVDQVQIMQLTNRALLQGGAEFATKLPQMMQIARAAALSTGQDMTFMFESIVQGIAKQQPEILDNLGIIVKAEDAYKAFAASIGTTADKLTQAQKTQAFTNEAMRQGADYVQKVGASSATTSDNIAAFEAKVRDLKTTLGDGLITSADLDMLDQFRDWWVEFNSSPDSNPKRQQFKADTAEYKALRDVLLEVGAISPIQAFGLGLQGIEPGLLVLREIRKESEALIYPAGQLPLLLRNLNDGMVAVATTGPGQLPYWVGQLNAAGGAASAAVGPFLTLEGAILRAQGASRAFATTPMKGTALETSISQVENKLSNLAGLVDSTTLTKWRDKAVMDLGTMFRNMGNTTSFGMSLMTGEYLKGWDTIGEEVRKKQTTVEKAQTKHIERLFDSASTLKSAIESALQGDMTVTGLDLQLSKEGKYTDKVNEAARQLQAIAERGFRELQVHPDWATALKIPPEVLSGSEAQLKDWAGQTAQNVNANLRPDLINWDAFISNFKRGLEDNAAKNLTIDVAVGKLKEAGLLEADTQALRDQIAAQLGIKAPSLTIDTLFAADEGAGASLVKQATGPTGFLEVPAMLKYLTPAGTGENAGQGTTTALMPPTAMPAPAMPTGVDQVGTDMATSLLSGFNLTLANTDVGSVTLGVWSASFYAQSAGYGGIGTGMGHVMAGAFIAAMKDDFEGIQDTIAGWLLPSVERRLKRSSGGRGAID